MTTTFRAVLVLIGALVVYVSAFAFWWQRSPHISRVLGGRQAQVVEFQYNTLIYYTLPVWLPALKYMELVCG